MICKDCLFHKECNNEQDKICSDFLLEICKSNLYKKVNEEETLLEFIRNSEKEFDFEEEDLETMSEDDFTEYVNYLAELWDK
ncbi:hypothetical protein [Petroclostridium sp. X23]|uniref:hypothetical protein n=1 Tax=Petroclostridium sp. X23 TaxID=3045146 RepID=UPI0024AE42D4|nr:hypothetical protein [Petroclostridium sp. X23]WHH58458.1 hypothetical protein QKW49_22095 [Petroclostridium sp. X23]